MTENVNILGDLQRLKLEPGDKFILTSRHPLPMQAHELLQKAWNSFIGDREDKPTLLILDDRLTLQVVNIPLDQEAIDIAKAILESPEEEILSMVTVEELKKLAGALLK